MKCKLLAIGALALIAAPALAQVPQLSAPGRTMHGIKASQGNGSGGTAAVLWDQSDYDVAANAFVDQDFTDLPSFSSYIVADIDTGGASWNVSKASAYFTTGFGLWSNAITLCNVQVYPKTGSLPGGGDAAPDNVGVPCTLTLTPAVDGWIVAANTAGVAELQGISGQFWCGVTPQAPFGTYGQEFHYETIAAQGIHSAWINPGGGFGLGSTWQDLLILANGTNYESAIKLEGSGGGGGYTCSVTGSCPGTVTVHWSGAQPNKQQAIVFGQNLGNTTIPSGPCAGTTLGVAGGVMQVGNFIGTGNGSGQVNGQAGNSACHHYLQLVTGGSCATSSVGQIP